MVLLANTDFGGIKFSHTLFQIPCIVWKLSKFRKCFEQLLSGFYTCPFLVICLYSWHLPEKKSFMLGKYGSKYDEPDRAICHLLQCHESRIHIYLPSLRPYPDFWNISLSIVTCRSEFVVPLTKCLTRYLARPINFPNSDKSPNDRILCGLLYI